jgi:uncharacterized membrane protein (UPF0127 family)
MMRSWAVGLVGLLGLLACGDEGAGPPTKAQILSESGEILLEVAVDLADTEEELQDGLRRFPPLAQDEGLLLLFPTETTVCIANAGIAYPIDVLYASADRQVIAVESVPADAPGPYCHPDTAMVLELRGGALQSTNPTELRVF